MLLEDDDVGLIIIDEESPDTVECESKEEFSPPTDGNHALYLIFQL